MNYLKISLGIFVALAASRFVPHPPNFTSLIALSFYVPVFLGIRFIPAVLLSFALTDIFLGFHNTTLFTWGCVLVIGLISTYFSKNLIQRLTGTLFCAFIFYIITNFGVWSNGYYGYTLSGLFTCYLMAIPFFGYTMLSTVIFSMLIETLYKFKYLVIKY